MLACILAENYFEPYTKCPNLVTAGMQALLSESEGF